MIRHADTPAEKYLYNKSNAIEMIHESIFVDRKVESS